MTLMTVEIRAPMQPYTTTTQRSKGFSARYAKYARYKDDVQLAAKQAMVAQELEQLDGVPQRIAVIYNAGQKEGRSTYHVRDLTNILKGTEDGAQGTLFRNDSWTDQEFAVRVLTSAPHDRTLLVVEAVSDGPIHFDVWVMEVLDLAREMGFEV